MSRATLLARLVHAARRSATALTLGAGLLATSLGSAQSVGELEGELVAVGDWSATETTASEKLGAFVQAPPPDKFWPASDCPIVEGGPRCLYVIQHDSFRPGTPPVEDAAPESASIFPTLPEGIQLPAQPAVSTSDTRLRIDARNFSGRPATIDVLSFDTDGGFRTPGSAWLRAGRAMPLFHDAEGLETVVVVSDTRLRLSALVESGRIVQPPPRPDVFDGFCFTEAEGFHACDNDRPQIFNRITSHAARVDEIDCANDRGNEFLCRALRYLP